MGCHFMRLAVANRLEAIDYMVKFLTRTVGWTIAEIVTNNATTKDFTLRSTGEPSVDNPNPRYIRFQSQATSIKIFTYETYTSSVSNTGELVENTNGLITLSTSSIFTVVADLERVFFHVSESAGTTRYFGYVGRLASYYSWTFHPYPNVIKGMTAVARDFFGATHTTYMRRQDGTIVLYPPMRMLSDDGLFSSALATRNRRPTAVAIPLYYSAVANQTEFPGELRGIYNLAEDLMTHDEFVMIDGRLYWCFKGDGIFAYAAGPVSEDNNIPPEIPRGLNLVSPL